MKILPRRGRLSTTEQLHHLNFNETEPILKAAPYKTAAVWQLTSHLTNHPSKTKHGHCRRNKDEHTSNVFLWTPSHGHTSVG